MTQQYEHDLLDRILRGDQDSYAEVVDHYKNFAFTIALKILNNRSEAEEATQDAFVKAFHYLKNFNRQARFSTWLYRIVFNTAITYKRKNRQVMSSIEFHDTAGTESSVLEKNDRKVFITRAMDQLSETDRLAIQLFYIKEFSLEESAEMLGQNLNTLKVRIHRARQRLAEILKKILKEEALTL